MKSKVISLKSLIISNIILFITNYIATMYINSKINIWFIFSVLFVLSIFEILFFYRTSKKTFKPLEFSDGISCVLLSIGTTVVTIGTILLVISLFV